MVMVYADTLQNDDYLAGLIETIWISRTPTLSVPAQHPPSPVSLQPSPSPISLQCPTSPLSSRSFSTESSVSDANLYAVSSMSDDNLYEDDDNTEVRRWLYEQEHRVDFEADLAIWDYRYSTYKSLQFMLNLIFGTGIMPTVMQPPHPTLIPAPLQRMTTSNVPLQHTTTSIAPPLAASTGPTISAARGERDYYVSVWS